MVRSCITPRSKCTDYYYAFYVIDINLEQKRFTVKTNPFIHMERHSERDYDIYNNVFTNSFGTYYMFKNLKGHTLKELSLNKEMRDKLREK